MIGGENHTSCLTGRATVCILTDHLLRYDMASSSRYRSNNQSWGILLLLQLRTRVSCYRLGMSQPGGQLTYELFLTAFEEGQKASYPRVCPPKVKYPSDQATQQLTTETATSHMTDWIGANTELIQNVSTAFRGLGNTVNLRSSIAKQFFNLRTWP